MTYKLLALNIDETVLKSNARISKQTKDAIEYVKEKGVYVTLATSRPFPATKKIAKALKVDGFLISSDGAFIATDADEPIFVRRLKEEKALQIVDILERYDCHIRVLHESFSIGNKVRQRNHLIAKMTIGIGDPLFYPISFVDSVCERLMEEPIAPPKIQVQFFDSQEQKKAVKQLEEMVVGITMFESAPGRLELVSTGVSKARGLQTLGQYLGIASDEMVAIGAQDSDVEMINQVGLGVAMGNATESVKNVAGWLTRSNEQNGVSYMIREVFRKQLRVQL
ncbi:Cof-type HAD-IIB family hydrolase [Halalkalibacter lacteus]|uniref:Cof-type HAD-IIB family hydrolase n=1 Tax=Halalkalibacter lacteus TaxID=3090663 RepID=UPI002FCB954A